MRPHEVIDVCTASHATLIEDAAGLSDDDVRAPSRLPGWTRAHLLTHLARNADSLSWLFEGAMIGEAREQYPRPGMRDADIEAGSSRDKEELVSDLAASCRVLEDAWAQLDDDLWDSLQMVGVGPRTMSEIAFRRLREVEVHHVDLDVGYDATRWPSYYLAEEMRRQVEGLPARSDHVALVEWLLGRGSVPELGPWG